MRPTPIYISILVVVLLLGPVGSALAADMVVIVNKANTASVDRAMAEKIFKA